MLRRLRNTPQGRAIAAAAEQGGYVERAQVMTILGRDESRKLTGFTKPIRQDRAGGSLLDACGDRGHAMNTATLLAPAILALAFGVAVIVLMALLVGRVLKAPPDDRAHGLAVLDRVIEGLAVLRTGNASKRGRRVAKELAPDELDARQQGDEGASAAGG